MCLFIYLIQNRLFELFLNLLFFSFWIWNVIKQHISTSIASAEAFYECDFLPRQFPLWLPPRVTSEIRNVGTILNCDLTTILYAEGPRKSRNKTIGLILNWFSCFYVYVYKCTSICISVVYVLYMYKCVFMYLCF